MVASLREEYNSYSDLTTKIVWSSVIYRVLIYTVYESNDCKNNIT